MTTGDRIADDLLPVQSGRARTHPSLPADAEQIVGDCAVGDMLVFWSSCAPSRALELVRAVDAAGVRAIVATSFSPGFFAEALASGLAAVAIEEAAAIKSGDRLRVDVETRRIVNLSSGDRYVIRNFPDEALEALRRFAKR